jgi:hypothetical protein
MRRGGSKVRKREQIIIIALCVFLLFTQGCVKRNLHVKSNPPGAEVYFNEDLAGTTPFDYDFIHYALHKVEVKKEGYKTLTVLQNIKPPLHLWPPLDFFFEIIPRDFWDRREVIYDLEPYE